MRKLTHQEILNRQAQKTHKKRLPFTVVLNNIRSAHNVGSIFRTADGAGIEKIWLCGITASPPNNQIAKTALGAQEHVAWEYHPDALEIVQSLKKQKYQIILLEQMHEAQSYAAVKLTPPVCLVLGNEIQGISPELMAECDAAVDIEMAGTKNSLNVAVAFGIVAYHFRQMLI